MRRARSLAVLTCLVFALIPVLPAAAGTIGNITGFTGSGATYTITAGTAKVRVAFARADIFRLWLAPDGTFTDPAAGKLAVQTGFGPVTTTATDLPRQDGGTNGRIGRYEAYGSPDNATWGAPVATGEWADTVAEKRVSFPAKTGRYLRLRALSEAGDSGPWTSAAEIGAAQGGGN
jgi:hypothetical protein